MPRRRRDRGRSSSVGGRQAGAAGREHRCRLCPEPGRPAHARRSARGRRRAVPQRRPQHVGRGGYRPATAPYCRPRHPPSLPAVRQTRSYSRGRQGIRTLPYSLAGPCPVFRAGCRFLARIAGLAWGAWPTTPAYRGMWTTTPKRPRPARGACGPRPPRIGACGPQPPKEGPPPPRCVPAATGHTANVASITRRGAELAR